MQPNVIWPVLRDHDVGLAICSSIRPDRVRRRVRHRIWRSRIYFLSASQGGAATTQDVALRRRHQARRPPLAKIRRAVRHRRWGQEQER